MKKLLLLSLMIILLSGIVCAKNYDVYYGNDAGFIFKFNSTGNSSWNIRPNSTNNIYGLGIDNANNIYSVSYDTYIRKFNSTGTAVWKKSVMSNIIMSGFINGTVYGLAGYNNGSIMKFYLNNGSAYWVVSPSSNTACSIIGDNDGNAYFGTSGDPYYVYKYYSNGTLAWKFATSMYTVEGLAFDKKDSIYASSYNSGDGSMGLKVINATTGTSIKNMTDIESNALYSDGSYLYIGNYSSTAYSYLIKAYLNGTYVWTKKITKTVHLITDIDVDGNGNIFTVDQKNNITALFPNGTMKWYYTDASAGVIETVAAERAGAVLHDVIIYLNGASYNITSSYPYMVNFICDSNVSFNMFVNGTEVTNNSVQDLKAGFYNFSCNNTEGVSQSLFVNISKGVPFTRIFINDSAADFSLTWPQYSNITVTSDGNLFWLWRNLTHTANPEVINLNPGYYSVFGETFADENWTGSNSTTLYLNVSKTTPIIVLNVTPNASVMAGDHVVYSCYELNGLSTVLTINGLVVLANDSGSFGDGDQVFNCSTAGSAYYFSGWSSYDLVVSPAVLGGHSSADFSSTMIAFVFVVLLIIMMPAILFNKKVDGRWVNLVLFLAALVFVFLAIAFMATLGP